jgi:MscS family membrane protein
MLSSINNSVILSGVFVRSPRTKTQSKDSVSAAATSGPHASLHDYISSPVSTVMKVFQKPRGLLAGIFFLACCLLSAAQSLLPQVLQPSTAASAPNTPTDFLGRATPSGAVLGFLQAAQKGDNSVAAQYLQMSAAHRQAEGEQMAAQLKFVVDRAFTGRVGAFNQPEGIPQEGVPPGRQRLGTMSSGDVEVDLDLVRVSDPNAGKIWLISADTLARIPELYDQAEARQVKTRLPGVLVKHQFAGMPLWQWLALLLALPLAAAAGWLVLVLLEIPVR